MKYLILVRHGDYGVDGRLTTIGNEQLLRLGSLLKEHIGAKSVLLFSSPAPRATDSADLLAQTFEIDFDPAEAVPLWWSDEKHVPDFQRAIAFIRERAEDADALIVVTHLEYVEELPDYFGSEILGVTLPFVTVEKGDALAIDCEARTISLVGRATARKSP